MKIKFITILLSFSLLLAVPDKQLSLNDVHVYFADRDAKIAEIALNTVLSERDRLINQYGLELKPLHISIADNQKIYNLFSGSNSPAWSVGLASHDKMLVKSPSFSRQSIKDFKQTLVHETVHLVVSDLPLPVWFNEGFAQYESGQFDVRQKILVSRAFWRHDLEWAYEIQYLMHMNRDKAEIVYAQCSAMFEFLVDYFSPGLIGKCLYYTRNFNDFEKGFGNAFLMDTRSYEKLFREKAKNQYLFYILLDQNNIWVITPFIVILGFILTRIRRRKIMASWDEEEKSQATEPNIQETNSNSQDARDKNQETLLR